MRSPARVQFLIVGHGGEARAEVWVTTPQGEQLRWPVAELGVLAAVESGAITAAQMRRKAAGEGLNGRPAFKPDRAATS